VVERQKREREESALEDGRRRSAEAKRLRWGQLNRKERNARAREAYRERVRRDAESVRAESRGFRLKYRAEIRARKRKYREAHREAVSRPTTILRSLTACGVGLPIG
jgi:hypothetical protein